MIITVVVVIVVFAIAIVVVVVCMDPLYLNIRTESECIMVYIQCLSNFVAHLLEKSNTNASWTACSMPHKKLGKLPVRAQADET